MKMPVILMLSTALISFFTFTFTLTACSSVSGNVVPKSGPAMEKVYDSMSDQGDINNSNHSNQITSKQQIKQFREDNIAIASGSNHSYNIRGFHKIPNPELQMYIYPHLGGRDQIPVPGYTTEFNVYNRDYYAL